MNQQLTRKITFPSADPEINLSGHHFLPANAPQAADNLVCVLVHPWGILGGSQANTVPIARALAEQHGLECLTFDLRGVGNSAGSATYTCVAEIQDAIGACAWVSTNLKKSCVLVGSSAGAAIAGSALDKVGTCVGYIGIGYTFGKVAGLVFGSHFQAIVNSPKPKLFIMGDSDGFTSVKQLECKITSMVNAQFSLIPGVGHFALESGNYTDNVAELIAKFVVNLM